VVSVEYRKAPESIFPSMVEDCVDAALYALSDEGRQKLGGPLTVMSGESAGAYLTVLTAIKLRDNGVDVRAQIKALAPCYGIFDLTYLPSLRAHQRRALLGQEDTYRFIDTAFPPSVFPPEKRKSGDVSPLYAQLEGLPPALFLVGTADPLLDDSVFMASRWTLAGNEAKLVIVPEAVHGFTLMPTEVAEEGIRDVMEFLKEHI
jgi:acetyl esterase/lipase